MKRVPFTKSLMQFNSRVLDQGTPNKCVSSNMDDIKQLLFYNKVFIQNSDELFSKYDPMYAIPDYIKLMGRFNKNMNTILRLSSDVIHWNKEDSFEARYMAKTRLKTTVNIDSFQLDECDFEFDDGYYIVGLDQSDVVYIIELDMNSGCFERPLCIENEFWKTDKSMVGVLESETHGVEYAVVKIVCNGDGVSKVEYSGNDKLMNHISGIFGDKALIIKNPYVYMDDIQMMINKYANPDKEIQRPSNLNMINLLEEDKLIEFPNDSYTDYLEFLQSVINNPNVSQLYMTLYRIGHDRRLYYTLKNAVDHGILVKVNLELDASGDESINAFWKRELKAIGVNVTSYGKDVIKVHSKMTYIRFLNGKAVCQIGTGNYNPDTSTQYTDLSLITSDDSICHQVKKLFDIFNHSKTDYDFDNPKEFNNDLLVTKFNVRGRIVQLIDREGKKGEKGYICIKCNALDDDEIIEHLDDAALNGCVICLIIRGVCTWIPDYPNVIVKSIVWEKLEHSRVYAFGSTNPVVYMGSLDLVTHKIDERIETMVRIKDPDMIVQVCTYLNRYIACTNQSWVMLRNGVYRKE